MTHAAPLRVLVPGLAWPPETFLARLFRGLAARGIRLTLVAPQPPDSAWRAIPNLEVRVIPRWDGSAPRRLWQLGGRLGGAARRASETRRLVAAARSAPGDGRPLERLYAWLPFSGGEWDVVYFPWNTAAIAYWPLLDGRPSVISCRGAQINIAPLNPERAALRDGLKMTFAKATAVHCVSEAIRREAAQYGLDEARAVVIRPAVDPDVFRPGGAERANGAPLSVISTGSVIWRKGYEYALSAVRRLVERGVAVRYDIIGDGAEQQRLLYTIDDLGLGDVVHWHGRLGPDEVLARLQAADVFLLTSLSEGISNAVLEGMACGLPVVTTDVGGMAEAVTDGVEGFLVPPRDPAATADALYRLWARPELRQAMGAAGRQRVQRDFNLDDQIDAFAGLLRRAGGGQ